MRIKILALLVAGWMSGPSGFAHQTLELGGYDLLTAKSLIGQLRQSLREVGSVDCQRTLNPASNSAAVLNQELVNLETVINSVDGAGALADILAVVNARSMTQVQPREVFHHSGDLGETVERRLLERTRYGVFYLPGKGLFLASIHSPYRPVNRYFLYRLNHRQFLSLLDNLEAKLEE